MATTRTAEDRISRCHMHIFVHPTWCTFSGLLMMGEWKITSDPRMRTACVDAGGNKMYDRNFVNALDDKELMYLVLHETLHFAFSHMTMWKKYWEKDPQLANVTADEVVNNTIEDGDPRGDFATMPKDKATGKPLGICDRKYKGWSFKEIWKQKTENGEGGKGGAGFDTHSLTGNGKPLTPDEEKALQQAVDVALRNGAFMAGKRGGDTKRLLGDLLEPKVDWRDEFMDFAMDVCTGADDATWRKPNRRFVGDDLYLPSYISQMVGPLVVGGDTSGSIGQPELTAFLSETVGVVKVVNPERLHLLWWDTAVAGHEEYTPDEFDTIASRTKPAGGGGTAPECVFEYIKEKKIEPVACIILTDGQFSMPQNQPDYPVLWVSIDRGPEAFSWGKVIRLKL